MSSGGFGYGAHNYNNGYQYVNDTQGVQNWSGGEALNPQLPPPAARPNDIQPQHGEHYPYASLSDAFPLFLTFIIYLCFLQSPEGNVVLLFCCAELFVGKRTVSIIELWWR